jgi:hypothetical protein
VSALQLADRVAVLQAAGTEPLTVYESAVGGVQIFDP